MLSPPAPNSVCEPRGVGAQNEVGQRCWNVAVVQQERAVVFEGREDGVDGLHALGEGSGGFHWVARVECFCFEGLDF
jgi:hypothetical protein